MTHHNHRPTLQSLNDSANLRYLAEQARLAEQRAWWDSLTPAQQAAHRARKAEDRAAQDTAAAFAIGLVVWLLVAVAASRVHIALGILVLLAVPAAGVAWLERKARKK